MNANCYKYLRIDKAITKAEEQLESKWDFKKNKMYHPSNSLEKKLKANLVKWRKEQEELTKLIREDEYEELGSILCLEWKDFSGQYE